jgi:hypothetical protein
MMMQTADFWQLPDRSELRWLNRPRLGSIHVEGSVNSPAMIIVHIRSKQAPQMGLVQHDHLIQALATDTADEALHVGILPRATRRDLHLVDAYVLHALWKSVTVDAVAVA